jgi:hypothetical protein
MKSEKLKSFGANLSREGGGGLEIGFGVGIDLIYVMLFSPYSVFLRNILSPTSILLTLFYTSLFLTKNSH